jgi:hypothetical protein
MPARDRIHDPIVDALELSGWIITADPFVLLYGEDQLFVDLGAQSTRLVQSQWIGAERGDRRIAVEIKGFQGHSAISDLYRAIGQFIVYNLVLQEVEPTRELFLAISRETFENVFCEPLGQLVLRRLLLRLIVVDLETREVVQWIEPKHTARP